MLNETDKHYIDLVLYRLGPGCGPNAFVVQNTPVCARISLDNSYQVITLISMMIRGSTNVVLRLVIVPQSCGVLSLCGEAFVCLINQDLTAPRR
jgi:hypothetical protein